MKKLTLAAAVLCGTIIFSSCKKEDVQPVQKANLMVDKTTQAQADFLIRPNLGAKANLGQADVGIY